MVLLELTENEASSLKTFLEEHLQPCNDCSPEAECMVYERGLCIAKNVESVLKKITI